ncbi:FAD-dependent oxidoreductase [Nocardia sp. NPDC088792]|uniref:FAD-dependent oxidoreductase n=1 Tax=Nocardia sp. NPDC088792 TaxID=3364332 RepID=UPI0038017D15
MVIGAGFAGLHCAAALADVGCRVVVFERDSALMSGASRHNWGRIHHGWHFAGSLATALESISSAFDFLDEFGDLLHLAPRRTRPPSWIAVAGTSFTSWDKLLPRAEVMRAHYAAECDRRATTFGPAEEFFRPLEPADWTPYLDSDQIVAAASTLEPFVDLDALAARVIARARGHRRVSIRTGHEVIDARPETLGDPDSPVLITVRRVDGSLSTIRAHGVVNAAWASRAKLDEVMARHCRAALPEPPAAYRRKDFLHVRLPAVLRNHPSCMVIHGPYAVFANHGDGTGLLDYAPATTLAADYAEFSDGADLRRSVADSHQLVDEILYGAEQFIPGIAAATPIRVHSGIVYNPGDADIDDPTTAMHHRLGTGVKLVSPRWSSLDTGKLSWVPRLTREVIAATGPRVRRAAARSI